MGNCGACCGKADTNEIVTEKQQKQKGVNSGIDMTNDLKRKEKYFKPVAINLYSRNRNDD